MSTYQGYIRTTLTTDERKTLKREASGQGMTLTGYIDRLLRTELERISHDTFADDERSGQ